MRKKLKGYATVTLFLLCQTFALILNAQKNLFNIFGVILLIYQLFGYN